MYVPLMLFFSVPSKFVLWEWSMTWIHNKTLMLSTCKLQNNVFKIPSNQQTNNDSLTPFGFRLEKHVERGAGGDPFLPFPFLLALNSMPASHYMLNQYLLKTENPQVGLPKSSHQCDHTQSESEYSPLQNHGFPSRLLMGKCLYIDLFIDNKPFHLLWAC